MNKILFLLSVVLLFQSSCVKEGCKFDNPNHVFEIPTTITPQKTTYKIGDTITISSTFNNKVYDRGAQNSFVLENFKFYPDFNITEISTKKANQAAFFLFEVVIDPVYGLDSFYGLNSKVLNYYGQYNYTGSSYNLEFKIIPKDTGLFLFLQYSSIDWNGVGDQEQEFVGRCDKKGLDVIVNMNGTSNNNINLLLDSPDEHYNTWVLEKPVERFHNLGGYAFYVK